MEMNEVLTTLEAISQRLIDEQELAALHVATDALKSRGAVRLQPASAGMRWSDEEDARLADAFDNGLAIDAIAVAHGRTKAAITLRLVKLGRIDGATVSLRRRG